MPITDNTTTTAAELNNFPVICSICQEVYENGGYVTLGCRHQFHPECIGKWCQVKNNEAHCPYCRGRLTYHCGHPIQDSLFIPGVKIQKKELDRSCDSCKAHGSRARWRELGSRRSLHSEYDEDPEDDDAEYNNEAPVISSHTYLFQRLRRSVAISLGYRQYLAVPLSHIPALDSKFWHTLIWENLYNDALDALQQLCSAIREEEDLRESTGMPESDALRYARRLKNDLLAMAPVLCNHYTEWYNTTYWDSFFTGAFYYSYDFSLNWNGCVSRSIPPRLSHRWLTTLDRDLAVLLATIKTVWEEDDDAYMDTHSQLIDFLRNSEEKFRLDIMNSELPSIINDEDHEAGEEVD
jgi:hypothetical protein